MSHEKDIKKKSGKKSPVLNLKEKRAAKVAKRNNKGSVGLSITPVPSTKAKKT